MGRKGTVRSVTRNARPLRLVLLTLNDTPVTRAGVAKLAAALPNCVIQSDHGTFGPASPDADRKVAEWVPASNGSVWLDLDGKHVQKSGPWLIENAGGDPTGEKTKLPAEPFKITRIAFWAKHSVSEKDRIDRISGLKHLRVIELYGGCQLTEAGLARIADVPALADTLMSFNLDSTGLGETGFKQLF